MARRPLHHEHDVLHGGLADHARGTASRRRAGVVAPRLPLYLHREHIEEPEAAFHVLQGALQFIFELCGFGGEVGAAEVLESRDAGASVRYLMQW